MTKNNKPNNSQGNSTSRTSRVPKPSYTDQYTIRESETKYHTGSNDATIEQIDSLLGNTGGGSKNNDNK